MKAENLVPLVLWLISCGGGTASGPPADTPPGANENAADMPPSGEPASAKKNEGTASSPAAAVSSPKAGETAAAPQKIEFPPHAGVEAAIKAVPQGAPRMNMSNDVLQQPLLDLKRYDKCKVPHSTKVALNVAVYDGVAVGVDVTTKPKNAKMEECLDGVVRSMTWDKVPSLNQVNVNF